MSFTVTPSEREEKEEVFSFYKKDGFEFSHSPEHAFTSGALSMAEIFWASPHRGLYIIENVIRGQSRNLSFFLNRARSGGARSI